MSMINKVYMYARVRSALLKAAGVSECHEFKFVFETDIPWQLKSEKLIKSDELHHEQHFCYPVVRKGGLVFGVNHDDEIWVFSEEHEEK